MPRKHGLESDLLGLRPAPSGWECGSEMGHQAHAWDLCLGFLWKERFLPGWEPEWSFLCLDLEQG